MQHAQLKETHNDQASGWRRRLMLQEQPPPLYAAGAQCSAWDMVDDDHGGRRDMVDKNGVAELLLVLRLLVMPPSVGRGGDVVLL